MVRRQKIENHREPNNKYSIETKRSGIVTWRNCNAPLAQQLAAPVLNRDGCAHHRERRPPYHKTLDGALQASTETSVTLVEGLFCQFLLLSPFRSSPPQNCNTRGTRRGVTRSDQLLVWVAKRKPNNQPRTGNSLMELFSGFGLEVWTVFLFEFFADCGVFNTLWTSIPSIEHFPPFEHFRPSMHSFYKVLWHRVFSLELTFFKSELEIYIDNRYINWHSSNQISNTPSWWWSKALHAQRRTLSNFQNDDQHDH